MKRKDFIKSGLGLLAGSTFMNPMQKNDSGFNWKKWASESDYNVIFIMADDLGYRDLGCYGQQNIKTPNIDRLASRGMRFTQCYAGCTVCAPSRNTLMTGRHTGHVTIRGNYVERDGKRIRIPLPEHTETVAKMLKSNGQKTGMIGKWGLGEPRSTGIPNNQGFDYWYGFLNQHRAHDYYPEYLWENQDKVILNGNKNGKKQEYAHDLFEEKTQEFIRKNKDERFFLYLPYTIPHAQYEIPDLVEYADKDWSHDEKAYAAMVTKMDRGIGRMLSLLKKLDLDKNTLIFVTSDNGAAHRWKGTFDSCGQLRGIKRDMYEGGLRVPMIATLPVVIPAGTTSEMPWYFPDLMPTLAEIAGMNPPIGIDGRSVWPALQGKKQSMKDRAFYWEFIQMPPNQTLKQAVRLNNWKAVRKATHASLELYDLSRDISEQNDVSREFKKVSRQMAAIMKREHSPTSYWDID